MFHSHHSEGVLQSFAYTEYTPFTLAEALRAGGKPQLLEQVYYNNNKNIYKA